MINYVFDLDCFISFEGKIGFYLFYVVVCVKLLMCKVECEGVVFGVIFVGIQEEIDLVLVFDVFGVVLDQVCENWVLNVICDYVFILVQVFLKFYVVCLIFGVDEDVIKVLCLVLVWVIFKQFEFCLYLLGMEVLEWMQKLVLLCVGFQFSDMVVSVFVLVIVVVFLCKLQ